MARKFLAIAMLLPLVTALAPVAQARDLPISPSQRSLVDQICMQVMGLKRGETQFAGCRASLAQMLPAGAAGQPVAITYASGDIEAGKSFFAVSPSMRLKRERYACAGLGLVPASPSFGQCLSGLEAAFMSAPN